MAITLAEAKVGMSDKVNQTVIDEFRRESFLLDSLTFDDCVSPGTGGSTLSYGYTMLTTPSTAAGRELNKEYTANEAKRSKKTTELKIFGGAFEVDRVLQQTSGAADEITFQLQQKIKAASNQFHNMVINGDSETTNTDFDGLDELLTGSSTEYKDNIGIDLSDAAALDASAKYFIDALDEFLSGLDGKPTMLMGNAKLINKIKACARRAGYYSRAESAAGVTIEKYNDIPLVDLGSYYDGSSTKPVVSIYDASSKTGLTDLYAPVLGLDGFHGISPTGGNIIHSYLPDLTAPGAVKRGEVEMVCGVCLKNSLKAGVFRGIKVK